MNGTRRPPTIIDVADAAGVGRSTASRVMKGQAGVKAATREKVLEAAERLGYSPNPLAQGMLSGRTHTIGVVLADVENPFFAQATRAITDTARDNGYDVILANTDDRPEAEQAAVRLMLDKRVDGIIVSPANSLQIDHLQRALRTTPVVLIDRKAPALGVDTVVIDNYTAAFRATQLLTNLGHTRIAVTSNARRATPEAPFISSVTERFDGVRAALRAAGITPTPELFWIGGWNSVPQPAAIARFAEGDRPTAVLSTDSLVALSTLSAARRAGLRVPDDLSLVTFDNAPWSEAFSPALSVVSQPVSELGATATRLVIERAKGYAGPPREVQLQSELIERESTQRREKPSAGPICRQPVARPKSSTERPDR
ncbi:LacI family DNA-binding transcriptional regulator [Arthrobacter sp. 2RAF6]|uniref:LacI family DNA-binding transcriptional regulator n=1 Tax=Arthrobacter sp. 2RAF6 TaxID=3233002 RepID=UPI003F92ADA3